MTTPPTYSYGYNPYSQNNLTGSKVDTVRRYLGITKAPWEICNEDVQFFIDDEGGATSRVSLYFVAHHVAQSIANSYADQVQRSMGPLSIALGDKIAHWQQVSEAMYEHATKDTTITPSPYSGTAQSGDRIDTDDMAVPVAFKRDQFDNYGTGTGSDPSDREHFQP
jgi:hypothetical protein